MIIFFLITGWAAALTLGVFYWVERDSHSMTRNWMHEYLTKANGWERLCKESLCRETDLKEQADALRAYHTEQVELLGQAWGADNASARDEIQTLRDEIERQHLLRDEANDDWCELFAESQKLQCEVDFYAKVQDTTARDLEKVENLRAQLESDYWKKVDELKASKDKLELFKRESAEKISQLEINLLDVTSLCEKLCLDSKEEVESLKDKLVRAEWNLRQIKRPSRAVKAALGLLS